MLNHVKNTYLSFAEFLDGFGSFGWMAAIALGFMLFWPVGLFMMVQMYMRGYAPVSPRAQEAQAKKMQRHAR